MDPIRGFVTVGGAGRSPVAPGTVGSLVAIPLIWLWQWLVPNDLITLLAILILSLLGALASSRIARMEGAEDPQFIVIDEFAGQWLALLAVPPHWLYWVGGFLLFRLFDITKPGWIDRSQHLPGGWGIMADDLLAGLLSFLILQGIHAIL